MDWPSVQAYNARFKTSGLGNKLRMGGCGYIFVHFCDNAHKKIT